MYYLNKILKFFIIYFTIITTDGSKSSCSSIVLMLYPLGVLKVFKKDSHLINQNRN